MNFGNQSTRYLIVLLTGVLLFSCVTSASAKQSVEIELTPQGKQIRQVYEELLVKLSAEVIQSLPAETLPTRAAFEQARGDVSALSAPSEKDGPKAHQ